MNPYTKAMKEKDEEIYRLRKMVDHLFIDPTKKIVSTKEKKMPYLKEGSLHRRKDGRWEAKLYIGGQQVTVACCKRQEDAHRKLKEAIEDKNRDKKKRPDKSFTLFSWLDHWHQVFRLPKMARGELAENTIKSDRSSINKIKKVFKDRKLKDVTADYIQDGLNSMTESRSCEAVYFTLKMALGKAKINIGYDVMEFVERIAHERISGRSLSVDEINLIKESTESQTELDIVYFYLYTGCRPDELTRTKVLYINLTDKPRLLTGLTYMSKPVPDVLLRPNEIFLDGTKNPLSQRCMPIFLQLRPVFERLCENRDSEEYLFDMNYEQIRWFQRRIKREKDIDFTLKDFRHTCATNCKDSGIPIEIYHKWFGWSSLRMAKQVYTHETELDIEKSHEWAKSYTVCAVSSGIREEY